MHNCGYIDGIVNSACCFVILVWKPIDCGSAREMPGGEIFGTRMFEPTGGIGGKFGGLALGLLAMLLRTIFGACRDFTFGRTFSMLIS